MLLVLAVVLLIIAVAGGIVVHPLLFLIAILALVAFMAGRRWRPGQGGPIAGGRPVRRGSVAGGAPHVIAATRR